MSLRRRIARLTAAAIVACCGVDGRAQTGPPRAEVKPYLQQTAVVAGGSINGALEVTLPAGLHANSNKPREPRLIPLVLSVAPPPGVTVREIVYPPSTDLRQENADQPLSVFERQFVIGVALTVATDITAGDLVVPARLRYQACDEKLCYLPVTMSVAWTVPVVAATTRPASQHQEVFSRIRFGTGEAPATRAPSSSASADRGTAGTVADPLALLGRFTTLGSAAGYLSTTDFLRFVQNAEAGVVEKGWFEGRGPLAVLVIVLLGGLALNLTPCVLPMIPINLAIIGAGAQAGSRRRGFLLGATYGGAMAVVYGALGLIVILTAGTFGTINSSPWFNAGIAILFVFLALAMFDVVSIDFSRFSSRFPVGQTGRGTFIVAFTLGALAALLAGACVAPVVIQVVLFASNLYATGTTAALALPFVLGLGMAIPWPIAGAGIAALPRPGPWMVRVKQAFGVFILATAAYYGYLSYELLANRWVDAADVRGSVEEKVRQGWYSNLAAGLAAAERERKPVLIDLWATWCKNCLTMDKTTLADGQVTAALANYVKVKFQAENPDEPPASLVMQRFGAIGLPTYVIIKPR